MEVKDGMRIEPPKLVMSCMLCSARNMRKHGVNPHRNSPRGHASGLGVSHEVEVTSVKTVVTPKRIMQIAKGKCPVCGTPVSRILGAV